MCIRDRDRGEASRGEVGPDFVQRLFLRLVWDDAISVPFHLRGGTRSPEELFFREVYDALLLQDPEKGGLPEAVGEPGDRRVAPLPEEGNEGRLFPGKFYSGGDVFLKTDPFFPFRSDGWTVQTLSLIHI